MHHAVQFRRWMFGSELAYVVPAMPAAYREK